MKLNKTIIILSAITLLAAMLRLFQFPANPPSLNWDEVSHGYNAFSILKTGKDEWGRSLPLIFPAFGDYKLPVYIYSTVFSEALFGLNAFAVRLPSVVAGILAIPGIYLLARELFRNTNTKWRFSPALLSAFFLALLPWHFFISRPALEANLALTLMIYGFYFLLRSIQTNNYLLPVIFLGLSLHTYNSARIFVPTLLVLCVLIYRPKIHFNRVNLVSISLLLLSSLIIVYQILGGSGIARYDKLKILSEPVVHAIGQRRLGSSLPDPLPRLIHNRPVYFLTQVGKNYISYFSPRFFYQSSGAQTQFAIPNQNLITLPLLISAAVGLVFLVRNIRDRSHLMIISWLFLAPLAASLTADPPQALRPNPMIPALVIIAVIGFLSLDRWAGKYLKNKIIFPALFITLFVFNFASYLSSYLKDYPKQYSQSWQFGYQQVFDYIRKHRQEFNNVIVTKRYGEPHIFYAFYNKLEPSKMWPSSDSIRFFQSDWYWTDRLDGIHFVNDWDIPAGSLASQFELESGMTIPASESLLITSPDHLPANFRVLETIYFLDHSPAFLIAKSI